MTQRCGLVAVVGAPNAGKSTLINTLVGQKVAIVSPKVQTTRTRLLGIAIAGEAQLLLVDTPGIFRPRRRLDRAMVSAAWEGTSGADVILLLIDARTGFTEAVDDILERLRDRPEPKMVALNKVDAAPKEKLLTLAAALGDKGDFAEIFMISATTGDGVERMQAVLAARMPEGAWHFPEDQVSDAATRVLATEITREQLYLQLHDELPYATAVETEKWEERRDGSVAIHHQILVERDSQKAIILGRGGAQIKKLGAAARAELEAQLERRVHLFLHVKVKPDWQDDRSVYRDMGLDWVE
jgi:GTP-binding protein Era